MPTITVKPISQKDKKRVLQEVITNLSNKDIHVGLDIVTMHIGSGNFTKAKDALAKVKADTKKLEQGLELIIEVDNNLPF